jgi:small subunit ribosomal protein S6
MNIYENVLILNSNLSDEDIDSSITKIKDFIINQGGEIIKVDLWGRRKLAYEINKNKKGYYVLIYFKIMPSMIKKLEDLYKVSDFIIKYMVLKLNKKQIQDIEKIEIIKETPEGNVQ